LIIWLRRAGKSSKIDRGVIGLGIVSGTGDRNVEGL